MDTKVRIIAKYTKHHSVVVHPQQARALGITSSYTQKLLHFGVSSQKVNIHISDKIGREEVLISRQTTERLGIPLHARYELRIKENGIHLGPYIGIMLEHDSQKLATYLYYLADYVRFYDQIGGAIIVFALDGVDKSTHAIKGYVYNPRTEKWEKGVYGPPSSMFIKTAMISPWDLRYFESLMGRAVFNNFNFNKWQMYKLLSKTEVKPYLPKSSLYKRAEDIGSFLQGRNRLYFKPVSGSRGQLVSRINKNKKGLIMRFREEGKNQKLKFSKFMDFKRYIEKSIRPKSFLIQSAINLISYEGSIIDFRMLMVKDDQGMWKDVGLVSRYGPVKSVVSNISAGGHAEVGEKTLQKVLKLSDNELGEWQEQLRQIAHRVAKRLDRSGVLCGNMGVDFGIDTKGKIWILEIQHNNPDPTLALDAEDNGMYLDILFHHLLYLKGLAGFGRKPASTGEGE